MAENGREHGVQFGESSVVLEEIPFNLSDSIVFQTSEENERIHCWEWEHFMQSSLISYSHES